MVQSENEWEGRSDVSFADAASKAVDKAEDELKDGAPREYDITLRVTATPGNSLSEYIALARGSG
ncbi:MAG: hypothetical protein AABM30_13310 [Actinomycetota bacterium]